MAIDLMTLVFKHSKSTLGARLVFLSLADFANEDGIAWPAVETLARRSRMSERNCRACLRTLENLGEITTEKNKGTKGSNRYRIILKPDPRGQNLPGEKFDSPRGEMLQIAPDDIAPNPSEGNRQKGTVKKEPAARKPLIRFEDWRQPIFKELWATNYKARFGRDYIFTKKDEQRIAEMLASAPGRSAADLAGIAKTAWIKRGPKFWNCERSKDIDFFSKFLMKIINELHSDAVLNYGNDTDGDNHLGRYGVPRGTVPLSHRPPPGEDEKGNQIGVDEWNLRFPLTQYDHDK